MLDFKTMRTRTRPVSRPRFWAAVAVAICLPWLAGCERTEIKPAEREQIDATLAAYLPKLAEAYARRDATLLAGVAAEKEIASVQKLIDELAERGEVMVPVLQSFTIEQVELWRSTVYVTTLEVWDLKREALGSNAVLQEYSGQRNRVKYHFLREGDAWLVLMRSVVDRNVQ